MVDSVDSSEAVDSGPGIEVHGGVVAFAGIEARNRRILVIDDNPAIHADFRKIICGSMPTAGALSQSKAAFFGEAEVASADPEFEMDSAFQDQEALQRVTAALGCCSWRTRSCAGNHLGRGP